MSQSVSDRQASLDSTQSPVESPVTERLENDLLRFDLHAPITDEVMAENADHLMSSLFIEVDRLLERGILTEPLSEPLPDEVPATFALPVIPLETILPPKVSPRDLIPREPELPFEAPTDQSEIEPLIETATPARKSGWNPLWLAVLFSSLLLSAGIVSFLFRAQLTRLVLDWINLSQPAATPVASPHPHADFLQYIQRSLDRLSQQQELPPSPPVASVPSPSPAAPTVIERVYVPIYPSPSPIAVAPAANSANPSANRAPSPATNPSQPAPSQSLSTLNSAAPTAPTAPSPAAVPNIATAASHTLVGILELGERSAALFEINGIPQRIEIGAPIGRSGWILVSISNQEAIVRRNGEVRSIYVGQKF
ncbi:MAG: hypothetical protein MUF72_14350 [Elainella sp. Prado103]|jgi:hypothetical protein|nr:hypothetical protein [Elainella sp. Prado103]